MRTSPAGRATTELATRVGSGEPAAVARALSIVERGGAPADALLEALAGASGRALLVGVTGPPGAGKSTLVSQLIGRFRARDCRVAVLAVDPTSPFSGGALLGDRVRMHTHVLDAGVFIRSMATRGHLGGLSAVTAEAADILAAAGFDVVLVETVGVGQDEVDIARLADVCLVVTVPGTGDDVQAMKAGIMEIADVFVVNKADLPGADRAAAAIEQGLDLGERVEDTRPPVVRVIATTGAGIDDLMGAIDIRRTDADLVESRRQSRAERRLADAIAAEAERRVRNGLDAPAWSRLVEAVAARRASPARLARELVAAAGAGVIDHVGVATSDLAAALAVLTDHLALPAGEAEDVASQGVRVRFVGDGDTRLELIEALDETSPFARSLERRGPGLHHVALRVADIAATLARLEQAGVKLIDRAPRAGAHGTRVAFVHPSSANGVLIELVERAGGDRAGVSS